MAKQPRAGVISRISAAVDGWVKTFTQRDRDLYVDRYLDTATGVDVSPATVMQIDAVWACVRLISETIASLPLSMMERTPSGKRVAKAHPLHFAIHDQPNDEVAASVFWEAFVASMLLRGSGRAEKLVSNGRVIGLLFLDPDKLIIRKDYRGKKQHLYPKADGSLREIPKDRVWCVPGFTLDGINGVSVIAYGAKVFGAAIAADAAASRTFKNGLLQTIYYKINQFLKPSQRDEFKKNLAGSIERGEVPLLEGGTEAGSLGIKPSDAQLLESRTFSVESVCRWFRVDPSLVGHGQKDSNWGTGLEQKMIWFLTFTLSPWLKRIEQGISKDLLSASDRIRYYPKYSVEGLLRADSAGRADFYAAMVNNGILTRDEVRELEDRPAMGGNAAVLTVQSAMMPLDSLGLEGGQAEKVRASLKSLLGIEEPAITQG